MIYLGSLGRMVPIKCPTAQRVNTTQRYSFATTLGGAVKAQAGPAGRRVWEIATGQLTAPGEVGKIMDFVNGAWGSGPFRFVPADAPVVNLLTPQAAACDPSELRFSGATELLGTPPMDLGEEGIAATSVWTNGVGTVRVGGLIPVLPGTPVTGSAWTIGVGSVRLLFYTADGASVLGQSSQLGTTEPTRLSVTATSPATAVSAQLLLTEGITQAARPAITWTLEPYPWGDGQGCEKAVLHDTSRDVVKAWANPTTGRWSDMSFTIQELG